jgi:septal ring-binding cell division protein DamX
MGVRGKGILNYRTKKNFQVELNYTRYDPNQTAINFNYLEERRAMVSFPVRGRKFSAFSRLAVSQNIMPATQYSTAEWLLSGVLFGVSTNFTTSAMFPQRADPFVYSNLSLGLRLPGKLVLRPQAQYDYTGNQFMLVKGELEKQFLKHGFMTVTYEYSFRTSVQSVQFGFRYDFSGVQTHVAYRSSNDVNTFYESARGSLLFDPKTKYLTASNRSSAGRGGIVILPFLDMNANSRYDKGEPKILGLRIGINGGRVEQSMRDSVIRIFDLEPYVGYFIELDKYSFDNIAWQMHLKSMSVTVDPNQFKLVEIPVSVMGEASGMVILRSPSGEKGLGRINVNFYRSSGVFFAKTLSEPDGYFSFLGFPPGSYVARLDTTQLRRLNMTASPATLTFEIDRSVDGDVEDGMEFVISPMEREEVGKDLEKEVVKEDVKKDVQKVVQEVVIDPEKEIKTEVLKTEDVKEEIKKAVPENEAVIYVIQVAASKTYLDPAYIRNKFNLTDSVRYFERDGWYKYVTGRFNSDQEAWSELVRLRINGFVTSVKASDLKSGMKTAAAAPQSGTVYCVQIAASRTYQDPVRLKNQFNLTDDVRYFQKDGWYKYVIGQYVSRTEAEARLAQSGISGFITAIDRSLLRNK